ncbi:glycosyltransferase family 2 protein [Catenuloplanes japonicus]|uniref:glycosyltransferase family 2 protein n=1 Tax=Catenuloplanes japonicus TaxID=33876 RepID=UPI000A9B1E74|nr:glycosyltransferase family 2 protein [Catenuloplanes japonicus]
MSDELPLDATKDLSRLNLTPDDPRRDRPGYEYAAFSTLAGAPESPPKNGYKVKYRQLPERRPLATALLAVFAFVFEASFLAWLIASIEITGGFGTVMIGATVLIELFRLLNVVTLCLATLAARDPIPVEPDAGLRVAFLTTIVPGREPVAMVERTLAAMRQVRHRGTLDVWLLDEGDDDLVKAICAHLGVHHFTRKGEDRWNAAAGRFKARTKHGNYNAWVDAHGADYDVFVSVDPDHAPLPNYCERLLGWFRDPDVAFVVGPQIYGNYDNVITKWAESQQYLFHSLLQRAGNRHGAPMLVGTNNAVRIAALDSVGGLQDSITEDMATSLRLHGTRNPATQRRWKSVYTPDVLAVGEGPSSWTDYLTQQHRWSRGTDDVLVRHFPSTALRLGPRRLIHYGLLMSYYPLTAIAWLLGAVNAVGHLVLGAQGIAVPQQVWLMLYADAAVFQVGLYLWNRRHNVSPHEDAGSSGLSGMIISTLCTPVYVSSFLGALLRRGGGFVVTPKGASASRDGLRTFAGYLRWAAFYAILLVWAAFSGHVHGAVWLWTGLNLAICLAPPAIWLAQSHRRRSRRLRSRAASAPVTPATRPPVPIFIPKQRGYDSGPHHLVLTGENRPVVEAGAPGHGAALPHRGGPAAQPLTGAIMPPGAGSLTRPGTVVSLEWQAGALTTRALTAGPTMLDRRHPGAPVAGHRPAAGRRFTTRSDAGRRAADRLTPGQRLAAELPTAGYRPADVPAVGTTPADTQPGRTTPADTHPSGTTPADTRLGGTTPADAPAIGTTPAAAHPSGITPADTFPSSEMPLVGGREMPTAGYRPPDVQPVGAVAVAGGEQLTTAGGLPVGRREPGNRPGRGPRLALGPGTDRAGRGPGTGSERGVGGAAVPNDDLDLGASRRVGMRARRDGVDA